MAGLVDITQYMRPDGRPVKRRMDIDGATMGYCALIKEAGFWLNNGDGNVKSAFKRMTKKFSEGLM